MSTAKAAFHWDDPFLLDAQLSDDERQVQQAARAYCQGQLAPRVTEAFRMAAPTPPSFAKWARWACWAPPSPKPMAARA
jgi:glutaryl-CoA dehydrogenase